MSTRERVIVASGAIVGAINPRSWDRQYHDQYCAKQHQSGDHSQRLRRIPSHRHHIAVRRILREAREHCGGNRDHDKRGRDRVDRVGGSIGCVTRNLIRTGYPIC